jgi:hypothetical protein
MQNHALRDEADATYQVDLMGKKAIRNTSQIYMILNDILIFSVVFAKEPERGVI